MYFKLYILLWLFSLLWVRTKIILGPSLCALGSQIKQVYSITKIFGCEQPSWVISSMCPVLLGEENDDCRSEQTKIILSTVLEGQVPGTRISVTGNNQGRAGRSFLKAGAFLQFSKDLSNPWHAPYLPSMMTGMVPPGSPAMLSAVLQSCCPNDSDIKIKITIDFHWFWDQS